MNSIQPPRPADAQAVRQPDRSVYASQLAASESPGLAPQSPKRSGYGLPCSKCKTYYAADLPMCPVCKTTERVSPTPNCAAPTLSEPLPECTAGIGDEAALEEERERFLRQFKSQVYAAHMQINTSASARCSLEENHPGGSEPAAVCQACYQHLREQVDLLEAALHLELKDATKVIYDAVWSDTSDPGRTYQNAAQALLHELQKRAGISTMLGTHRPLAH